MTLLPLCFSTIIQTCSYLSSGTLYYNSSFPRPSDTNKTLRNCGAFPPRGVVINGHGLYYAIPSGINQNPQPRPLKYHLFIDVYFLLKLHFIGQGSGKYVINDDNLKTYKYKIIIFKIKR